MINSESQQIIERLSRIKMDGQYNEAGIIAALENHLDTLAISSRPIAIYKSPWVAKVAESGEAKDSLWQASWDQTSNDMCEVEGPTLSLWNDACGNAWDAVHASTLISAKQVSWNSSYNAVWGAMKAAAIANSFNGQYIYRARQAPWLAMVDGLDAGLFSFTVTPSQVVACVRPVIRINEKHRIHAVGGPAIEWQEEGYYYLDGVRVEREIACAPPAPNDRLAIIEKFYHDRT